jgi:DNA polymerase-3 subunit beta
MDITVNREHLLPILNKVVGVVERRQTLPILGNLLVSAEDGQVNIVGTDLEIEIRASSEAKITEGGQVTIPARKLSDICRSLGEGTDIRFKVTGDRCVLTAERGRYVLGTLPAADFPSVETQPAQEVLTVEESTLKRLLEKTGFAMAQQDVRYYLNGLLLQVQKDVFRAVATDGHRLAAYECACSLDLSESRSVIIPFKTVNELRRQLGASSSSVQVEIGERLIRFLVGRTVTTSKLVDGRYPEYERVIPTGLSKVAYANKDALKRALSRTAILSNEKYRGVRLVFEPNVLRLVAHNPEQEEAVEEMELAYVGEPTTIGFNVAYLSDLLNAVDSESVEVRFEDGNSSSLWRGKEAIAETYVVMPMRL